MKTGGVGDEAFAPPGIPGEEVAEMQTLDVVVVRLKLPERLTLT